MYRSAIDFVKHSHASGIILLPKHHLLLHMFEPNRVKFTGNPRFFSNFYDEALNQDLKALAQRAHASVFEQRVLTEWKVVHAKKRRGSQVEL